MAIISVAATDSIGETVQHKLLPEPYQATTFIPRGVATHEGTVAIATLAGGNQTQFSLTLSFPTNYTYLLKQASLSYQADTVEENSFGAVGLMEYLTGGGTKENIRAEFFSQGNIGIGNALVSTKTWQLQGHWHRFFCDGNRGDTVVCHLADLDAAAGGKVAGDMFWNFEWYFFDQEQMRDYPVHTAIPVLSY